MCSAPELPVWLEHAGLCSPGMLSLLLPSKCQSLNAASLKICHYQRSFLSSEGLCNLYFWEEGMLAGKKGNVCQPPSLFCPLLIRRLGERGKGS